MNTIQTSILILLTSGFALTSCDSSSKKAPAQQQAGNSNDLSVGPGQLETNFSQSANFTKANLTSLPITQHAGSQGRNADIYYSSNLRAAFGRTSLPNAPEGSAAIKKFTTPEGATMITAMLKQSGSWKYYMGGEFEFTQKQLSQTEAQTNCITCHQQQGGSTDLLPYLRQASVNNNSNIATGGLNANFRSSPNFIKATQFPIQISRHAQGQGKNAEIYYSSSLSSYFGQSSASNLPDGSMAIKTFNDGTGKAMITAMEKKLGQWVYYMSPAELFPGAPLSITDNAMCISCHQSQGAQTDLLPYLSRAVQNTSSINNVLPPN